MLAFLHLAAAQGPSHILVSAPNIIRIGNTETVLVSVFNTAEVSVTVSLKNGDDSEICPPAVVDVSPDEPLIVPLFVDPERITAFGAGEDIKQYAKVTVVCEELNFQEEKEILVSSEEGFVFIQTDKPIYTPDQKVHIRLLILDQYMRPSNKPVRIDVLTPQDVIVHRISDIVSENGFKTHIFAFPHEPLFGNWSVIAYYGAELKANTTVQFEVKEYVLPTFSVEITPPRYILEGVEAFDCVVIARYVYNKPVEGSFYAKIGVLGLDGEIEIKEKKQGQILTNGDGHFRVLTRDLGENWFEENVGKRLYIEVSVLEAASGHSENASDVSAKFVRSPYRFSWRRTVQYYKKGLPYEVKVDLLQSNDQPAANVPVEVIATGFTPDGQEQLLFGEERDGVVEATQSNTNDKGQVNFRIYVCRNCERIHIKLQTKNNDLVNIVNGVDNNAKLEFDVSPYDSPTGSDYLLIRLTQQFVDVGRPLSVEALVYTAGVVPHLAYFVISKGRIVYADLLNQNIPNFQGFQIPVTHDMIPTARIVAYYINQHGQVVADSLWIEVEKTCENRVSVGVGGHHRASDIFEPDTLITLQVDAGPQTTVGLLAVDKAVLLLQDYHRLTQNKMYETMDSYDSGCGPGGGRDSPDVFKNAGVTVLSSANLDVSRREEYACVTPTNQRRRRSLASQRESYSRDPLKMFACKRGHKLIGQDRTCEERSEPFLNRLLNNHPHLTQRRIEEILAVFILCCQTAERAQEPSRGRFGAGQDFLNPDLILDDPGNVKVRSDFRETWIFQEVLVGENGFVETIQTIPSSITQWTVSAVGLSQDYAMCVADPLEITVRSDLFIQLHMPYSVVRMEQVEIVATIFNYATNNYAVRVYLQTSEKVCSEGSPNTLSAEKNIEVNANSAYSVKYVVIGLEVGEHPIKVVALSAGPTDGVEKVLRVLPEGVERSYHHSGILDPSGSQSQPALGREPFARAGHSEFRVNEINNPEENHQVNIYDIRLPPGTVPGSEKCEVSIIGNVLGPVITSVIDGLESLLALPRGCGEQTMIYMAPNVYVLRYLTRVDASSATLEQKARSNINEGIIREMVHRHSDGSFSVWGTNPNYPSSTWLTAFVNKVFCHASEFEYVDPKVTCSAIEWLISNAQREDGAFFESYRVHHREMTGGVQGDVSLTAFVLISIHECECAALSNEIAAATSLATAFLEGELENVRRPYALAIVTYALALVGSQNRHHANLLLKSMEEFDQVRNTRYWGADPSSLDESSRPYWYRVRPTAIMVETTGYALLAQLALGDISYSHAIVRWLSEQQNYGGGFASTQDTTIALQALSEYAVLNDGGDIDMVCRIEHGDGYEEQFQFTGENALVQRHATPPAKGQLTIHSEGTGTGKVNVEVKYNVLASGLLHEECPFQIHINAREPRAADLDGPEGPPENPFEVEHPRSRVGDGRSRIGHIQKRQAPGAANRGDLIVNVRIRVGYYRNTPTGMAIIDVGIYSGFVPIKDDLDAIVQDNEYISRYEISQRSVIFYADSIPPVDQQPQLEFEFNVRRDIIVGNIQPVAVTVYDYYNPSEECTKFYHPLAGSPLLATVCGDSCICAAGECVNCAEQPKEVLLQQSCVSAQTYVYQVLVTDKRTEGGFTIVTAVIKQVLKIADDADILVEDVREFWYSASCTCPRMRENNLYVVIGHKSLSVVTRLGENSFKYVLDSGAIVESWPTRRRRRVREQFDKMAEFQRDMLEGRNGCQ